MLAPFYLCTANKRLVLIFNLRSGKILGIITDFRASSSKNVQSQVLPTASFRKSVTSFAASLTFLPTEREKGQT